MNPYYTDDKVTLYHGKCEHILPTLPDCSVDAVVTDPPYELGFMGKGWDSTGIAYSVDMWAECLRVLKPGGHALAFGGTRTWHRMAVAIEDAGFELRDSIAWIYGSGFPKSLDVSKAIDKAAGAEREVVGPNPNSRPISGKASAMYGGAHGHGFTARDLTAPATPDAERWQGWGTALKPAFEPVVAARKPLQGTVAANILAWGTGAINVDGCRVGTGGQLKWAEPRNMGYHGGTDSGSTEATANTAGRWPANVTLDPEAAAELDRQSGERPGDSPNRAPRRNTAEAHNRTVSMGKATEDWTTRGHDDTGGASRFFPTFRYEAKAPTSERPKVNGKAHATVKPLTLMSWLVRLVTPPGGIILDPFAGSGTTGEACVIEGFNAILIEMEEDHLPLITQRLSKPIAPVLDLGALA